MKDKQVHRGASLLKNIVSGSGVSKGPDLETDCLPTDDLLDDLRVTLTRGPVERAVALPVNLAQVRAVRGQNLE